MRELNPIELNAVSGGFSLVGMMNNVAIRGAMTNMATYNAASLISTGELGTVRGTVTAGVIGAGAVKLNSTLQTLANGDKVAERVWQTNVAFGKFVANRVNHAIDAHNRELEAALDF